MNPDHVLRQEIEWLKQLLYQIIINQETKIMPALDDARTNLSALQTDVSALLARPAGGVPESEVQAIADALAALDADIKAALGQ